MTDPASIVRDLAQKFPVAEWGRCLYCHLMFTLRIDGDYMDGTLNPVAHADTCVWRRSREWVAENPA